MKWVIGAVVGGIASAATGFWLDRVSNKRAQDAPAPEVAQRGAPAPNFNIQLPGLGLPKPAGQPNPAASQPVVWPKPDAFTRPDPVRRPEPGPTNPEAFQPKFEKPKTPPAATEFNGLLAYWPLDEGSGTQAVDSQKKRKAVLYGGGKWVSGIRGQAVEFNGANECIDLGPAPELNFPARGTFTLACWVKTESKTGTVFWFRSHPDGLTLLGVKIVDGKLRAWVRHDGGVFHPSMHGGEAVNKDTLRSGEWHHVALTRQASGEIELYQDGRFVEKSKGGGESAGRITSNVRALGVDAHAMLLNPKHEEVQPLQGCVDEFCVFGRVLTAEEIAKLAGRDP